jgi:beta-lactamase regulating signal transducer with metallopeptidase domain
MLLQDFLDLSSQTARFLFAWSWQVFLLLAMVALMIRLSRFRLSTLRYRVWLLGLAAAALLPVCTFLIQAASSPSSNNATLNLIVDAPRLLIESAQAIPTESFSERENVPAAISTESALLSMGFMIWAFGFIVVFSRLVGAYLQSQRVCGKGQPISFGELGCEELDKAGVPECRLCDGVASPMLVGLWHSTILLPADILRWTTADERRAILLHEMIHAERKDQWGNLFQTILSAIFYFHPLVRYACKQLYIERELSCDEQVLAYGTEASSYAESILKVAEKNVSSDILHQPAFITKKMLERRIEMIMKNDGSVWSARRWTLLILPIALIATSLWALVPNRAVAAKPADASTQEVQEKERHKKIEEEREAQEKAKTVGYALATVTEDELREHREREINQMLEGAEILAKVSELQLIYGRRYGESENLIDVSAEETVKVEDEVKRNNVVVKTPEFIFRAEHAVEKQGITNIIGNPIEVEHQGRVYYSYSAIAVAQRRGMVLYVVSKHGTLFTEKNQLSLQVEFNKLLSDSRR